MVIKQTAFVQEDLGYVYMGSDPLSYTSTLFTQDGYKLEWYGPIWYHLYNWTHLVPYTRSDPYHIHNAYLYQFCTCTCFKWTQSIANAALDSAPKFECTMDHHYQALVIGNMSYHHFYRTDLQYAVAKVFLKR